MNDLEIDHSFSKAIFNLSFTFNVRLTASLCSQHKSKHIIMKKYTVHFLLLTMFSIVFYAFNYTTSTAPTEEVSSFQSEHAPVWKEAIAQVMEVAEAMPEEHYSYQPTAKSKTFAEQLVHIGFASEKIANFYLKGLKSDTVPPVANEMSKAAIKNYLTQKLNSASTIISSISAEDLEAEITSFAGNKMSKKQAILFIHDHVTNHRAKANLYIRMNGIDPPKYRYY
jgi:uncharacterized damage-inducible protein DinB